MNQFSVPMNQFSRSSYQPEAPSTPPLNFPFNSLVTQSRSQASLVVVHVVHPCYTIWSGPKFTMLTHKWIELKCHDLLVKNICICFTCLQMRGHRNDRHMTRMRTEQVFPSNWSGGIESRPCEHPPHHLITILQQTLFKPIFRPVILERS